MMMIAHQPLLVSENYNDYPFMSCPFSMFYSFVTNHACDRQTDGWTDGQRDRLNYDPQDGASTAASRGKSHCNHRRA